MMDSGQGKIVLLVEDSPDHAFLIKRAMMSVYQDLEIVWVKDGKEALDFIMKQGRKPDLVLLDIKMPRMNGFELLKILKTNKETKYIPVVILSTSANKKDVAKAYSLGTNCYLSKPVEVRDFRLKLKIIPSYWLYTNLLPRNQYNEVL
ncbi:MAG: response regulator [Candidatus Hodarchaeota archaeon]